MHRVLYSAALAAAVAALAACSPSPSSSPASTQTSASAASTQATAPGTATANQSNVTRATLDNGLKVVIVRDPFVPVVEQRITYFTGGAQAPKGFPGIAHAQEHMMFRGAPGLSKNQLSAIIARLGGVMNATTSDVRTNYFFIVPKDDVGVALHVGALRMAGVNDTEKQWQSERGAIEQEVARDHSRPIFPLIKKMRAHLFKGTPYVHGALGTKASFDKLTAKQLQKFHDTWYVPNNALLVLAGDVNPQKALAKIKKLYGQIPKGNVPEKAPVNLSPVKPGTFTAPSDQPYGLVAVTFRTPGYQSPHYPAFKLAADALASKRGPIQALRYQGKVMFASFQARTYPQTGFGLALAVYSPGQSAKKVRKALVGAIKKVRKNSISTDVIKAAKRRAVLSLALQRNSIHGLAHSWARAIAVEGLKSPKQALERLRKVTPDQVNAEMHRFMDLDHAVTLITKPKPGAKPTSGKGFGGPESFTSKPSGPVTLPKWAKQAFAKLPHPEPSLHPTTMKLANGLRLIVQPLKGSQSVSLFGSVHQNGALQAPKGQSGVGGLLGALFAYGPQGMTRQQFDAAQGKIGAKMSTGPNFSLQVLPEHFDAGVKLLADDLLHPALPKQAFQRQQKVQARQAAGRRKSPTFKFHRAVKKTLYPKGDPALRLATAKTIGSLTPANVKSYYGKVYRPDETTIVVAGDVKPTKVKATVKKYFGDWKAKGAKPDLNLKAVPLSKKSQAFIPDPQKKQDQVVLAETLGLNRTNPAHYALRLANVYLSGGFYATPLYHVLREKLGLVYNVGSNVDFQKHRGIFKLHYGSYPQKVDEAHDAALKVLKKVISKPLTADQLHLAKSIGLRRVELRQQSVRGVARSWINHSENGLPLDQGYVTAHHWEKLTPAEIQKALKKYLDPSRLSTVVLGQPTGK